MEKHPVLWPCGRKEQEQSSLAAKLVSDMVSLALPMEKKKRKRKKQLCIEMSCKSFKAVICKILVFADGSCSGGVFALRFPEIMRSSHSEADPGSAHSTRVKPVCFEATQVKTHRFWADHPP